MKKYFIILTLLLANLYGSSYYYRSGAIEVLNEVNFNRDLNRYFLRGNGDFIAITNQEILLKTGDISKISKDYNITIKRDYSNGLYLIEAQNLDTLKLSNEFVEKKLVDFAHPNFSVPHKKRAEPLFIQQWYLYYEEQLLRKFGGEIDSSINVEGAWEITKGKGVKVAIIDDGFDLEHQDLKDGYIAPKSFYRYNNDVSHVEKNDHHGTACAGIIGARENSYGMIGVAPEATLIPIQIYSSILSDTIEAFYYARNQGASVINCSWGTNNVDDALKEVIDDLATNGRDGRGIVIIFATGNDNISIETDESGLANVIGVGSSTNENMRAWYSNYGKEVDLVAPSGGGTLTVTTLDPTGDNGKVTLSSSHPDYMFGTDSTGFNGTSVSAPIVSGVVALMLAINPNLSKDEVQDILQKTAKKVDYLSYPNIDGRNDYLGYGKVDAFRAVKRAKESLESETTLSLKSGWNLISLPKGSSYKLSNIENIDRAFKYSNGDWLVYRESFDTINQSEGVFVYLNSDTNVTFSGKPNQFIDSNSSGWRLIGSQEHLYELSENYNFEIAWKYSEGVWVMPFDIEIGEGFWVKKD